MSVKLDSDKLWSRRIQNLRVIIAHQGSNASRLAQETGLGINTVTTILRGESRPRADTLERVCHALGVSNVAMLDSENPISEVRNDLYRLLATMTDDQARRLLDCADEISADQS